MVTEIDLSDMTDIRVHRSGGTLMSTAWHADLPPDIRAALQVVGYTPQKLSEEAFRYFSGVLYARKVLSLEQAARLAGMTLWEFIPFLAEQGIATADYDAEETDRELEAVHWLTSNQRK
jgi:predicted HTH domain antitoxin